MLIALFVFGPDKLPELIGNGARLLRKLRGMARDASADLQEHLGPDVDITDLNPKRFVRKHLLSDDDAAALRRPFDELAEEVTQTRTQITDGLRSTSLDVPKPGDLLTPKTPKVQQDDPPRFDPDAT